MPMMASRNRHIFDAGAAVLLRDVTDGTETSTAAEAGVSLQVATNWFAEAPHGTFDVMVHVVSLDFTTGDETYVFSVESDTAAAETANVALITLPDVGSAANEAGLFLRIPVASDLIDTLHAAATFIRIKCTLGGTTPIITYGAWLVPSNGA